MGTRLYRKWTFSAAHKLASGARHECARLHGHTYEVEVCVIRVTHDIDLGVGWVADVADLDRAWSGVSGLYDHQYVNETLGEDSPTCEILARRIYEHMGRALRDLKLVVQSVSVSEGTRMRAVFDG